jgi:hypothetical protein
MQHAILIQIPNRLSVLHMIPCIICTFQEHLLMSLSEICFREEKEDGFDTRVDLLPGSLSIVFIRLEQCVKGKLN